MRRVLVIGRSGQLARALAAQGAGSVKVVCAGRPETDLRVPESLARALADHAPDVVINAAAETAVDAAESCPDAAFAVNAAGAGALAQIAAARGVPLVHVSTDFVLPGDAPGPHAEDAIAAPRSVYGRAKLAGERLVAEAQPDHVIVRTAWLFSAHGRNFVTTMLRLGADRPEIGVVDDQRGNPTFAPDLARVLLAIADRLAGDPDPALRGLVHAAGAGEATWAGLAEAVFAGATARGGPHARVRAITTAAYGAPAPRPADSRLDCTRLSATFGLALAPWREGLAQCLDHLAASAWRAS